ncbi:MAG: hypothetical protein RMX96_02195 [Nostoc sp. ChiSLP02]|nr:hypothetical protein [Nostoc sp. DedSLP05]MDZ8098727.1 hypothetical protein [Nostoc sp. DedSLP01]MDZ8183660.1 hypothetical protein [Nostoc sp. ChiSLP02]
MPYKQLFELSIIHEYYGDKICPDFNIEPTNQCQKILDGHRLILKNKVNGIVVIAPVSLEDRPWIELAENLQFSFILKLKNKDFIDFTQINWKPGDEIYQFSNQNNTNIETSNLETIPAKLSELNLPKGQDIFGIVNIYNNSSMPKVLHQSSEYKMNFSAKKQQWYYFLLTNGEINDCEFSIKDKDTTRKSEIKFTRFTSAEAEKTNPIFSVLQRQFPQSQQYLFISDSEIACQQTGIKNIQLLKQKKSEISNPIVWIEHLPNPPNYNGIQVINALKYL